MTLRLILLSLLALSCATLSHAQETAALARELVTVKGGYANKKIDVEELRIRAYVPILLKVAGKGEAWKPGHPLWADTERRIATEWRKLYADYMARMGRDTSYTWMDDALAREYAKLFSAQELDALLEFYRSASGGALLALEKEFLEFYPAELVRSLARVMLGNEILSERDQAMFRAAEYRQRRDFVALFETEGILNAESQRIGSALVASNFVAVQRGAIATAANNIDTLRQKLNADMGAEVLTFLKTDVARREREFITVAVLSVTPAQEDPVQAQQEEAAFYKSLAALSTQWHALANSGSKAPVSNP